MKAHTIEAAEQLWFPDTHDIPITPLINEPHTPIHESYDWEYIHQALATTLGVAQKHFSVPVFEFKSIQQPKLSENIKQELAKRDAAAADELREFYSGQFYKYYAGNVVNRRSRSFCIWNSIEIAREAMRTSEKHKAAARMASIAYEPENGMQVSWHRLHVVRASGAVALELIE